ncbi:AraC family transcriptional regulator [Chitinophaga sp. Cy-1792]|uniref:AraC family transcriptional regulator n=1 Tax=Chitinophaga sp. Cy-1792 TaxID=2608339 RepID=UPI00141EFD05|nr:AraC family transcriptional regulator [Chitinophaga sp. Cy-1792]NIG55635.1 helix-turn-helix transcriptional regulator [Chitinophaga sp. Cy-1792]
MEIRNLHQPYELDLLETSEYQAREHRKTFFEMVFVLEGAGTQIINKHRLPYSKDKLFLIFPQDTHGFEITAMTRFFFIRFNTSYLKTQSKEWIQKLEFIFHNYDHLPGCILDNITDKPLVRALVEALIREHVNQHPQQPDVIRQLINTIITIAARNMLMLGTCHAGTPKSNTALELLADVHQHIYDPEQLKTEKIAQRFNVSPTYISEYFKQHTGRSLQDYIISYKIKLIETRLQFTDMKMNEIVYEFGFSDASHLNRLFKKHAGLSPTAFKNNFIKKQNISA